MQEEIVKTFQQLYRIHKIKQIYWKRMHDSLWKWDKSRHNIPAPTKETERLADDYWYLCQRHDWIDKLYLKKQKEMFYFLADMYRNRTGISRLDEMPFYTGWTEFSHGKIGKFTGEAMLYDRSSEWDWESVDFIEFTRLNSTN